MQKAPKIRVHLKQLKVWKDRPCDGCGSTQHGSAERSSKCKAWKKTCSQCGKRGHFAKVCRAATSTDVANAIIASVNSKTSHTNEIELHITPSSGDMRLKGASVKVYPDTGATLCVVGPTILGKLGLNHSVLEPSTRRITTATGGKIHCIGKFQATLSIGNRFSLQDIYVCTNIRRFFLSRAGCIELGIVHQKFPLPIDYTPSSYSLTIPEKPQKLPHPPMPENIPLLKSYLLKAFSTTCFNNDKNSYFPEMRGVPEAHIHLKPKAKPFFRGTPNEIPHFWRNATKELLDQHVKRGIISRAPIGTPTPWCSPMVITPKKSSTAANPKLRMTVDLQQLNSHCIRELHHVESPFKLASQIPRNTYKTLLDAVDGYQAIKLDKESQPLTTFITPWGPYYFLRVPAGLIDSGDKYTSRYDQVIQHISRKVKCVDDTLLYDHSIADSFFHTFDYLRTCASHGITLNANKFQFCQQEITFAGFTITQTGIKPSKSTLQALQEFPTPKSTTDIRSWFGLVRQVAYAHSVSEELAPLRCLLKHEAGKKPKFTWSDQLQYVFDKSKERLVNSVSQGIETFDPERLSCLQCDWSKTGIGFLLFQKHCRCDPPQPCDTTMQFCCESGWKPIYAGSRFTNPAESRYAPTEGEALAVAWALKTSRLFTLGCPNLYIVTDHKPLLGILNGRDLGSVKNPRIRRLKERTLDYNFTIRYCPGKLHAGADALSRYPVHRHDEISAISDICESEIRSLVQHAINSIGAVSDNNSTIITLDKVELECLQDANYIELHRLVSSGFPDERMQTPDCAKLFWPLAQKGLLTTLGGMVLYQERIVIPKSLRTYIIRVLHSAHQGCTGMIARATTSVYWPGIRKDIMNYQTNCRTCIEIAPSQARQPLQLTPLPERPFQIICSDIFQLNNRFYLIIVDRFSGFLHIFYSRTTPTHKFIEKHIRDIFIRYGRPDQLDSDGGPQFQSSQFTEFLKNWNVKHRVSSPYYPQSNGRAELGVKTAKRLLRENTGPDGSIDNDKVACAVLQYHNTPLQNGSMSPAQLLFGRALADFLPVNPEMYRLHPYWSEQTQQSQSSRSLHLQKSATHYNFGTRELRPLETGQSVVIQNPVTKRWDRYGTITQALPHRKYQLRLRDTGNITSRNRRFLKPTKLQNAETTLRPSSGPSLPDQQVTRRLCKTPIIVDEDSDEQTTGLMHQQAPPPATPGVAEEDSDEQTATPIEPMHQQAPPPAAPREKLALRRLRPHNSLGLKET